MCAKISSLSPKFDSSWYAVTNFRFLLFIRVPEQVSKGGDFNTDIERAQLQRLYEEVNQKCLSIHHLTSERGDFVFKCAKECSAN